nr:methylmalonate-semialdehyde dehydrogenase [acylating], mitochondrial-like isoform X2 [Coffea arabica]
MKKVSGLQSTDSIDMVALIKIPSTFHSIGSYLKEEDCHKWFPSPYQILVLDGVQDPANLDMLLRSAMAFRWIPRYEQGNFLGPTILCDVATNMECYKEEMFGPVLCMQANRFEEAIAIVNRNRHVNGASIFRGRS